MKKLKNMFEVNNKNIMKVLKDTKKALKSKKKLQSENDVKRDVVNYLELSGYQCFRINNGAVYNKKRDCWIFQGKPGVSDLLAVNKRLGRILFIELKATKKKPSQNQIDFLNLVDGIRSVRGICVDSLDSLLGKLK